MNKLPFVVFERRVYERDRRSVEMRPIPDEIIVNAFGCPVWQQSGLRRRVAASTDLPHLCPLTDDVCDCDQLPKSSPDVADDRKKLLATANLSFSGTGTMTLSISTHSIANNCPTPVSAPFGRNKEKLREDDADDGPLYFICKGKLITLPNEAEIDKRVVVSTDGETDCNSSTLGVVAESRLKEHRSQRRNDKRWKKILPFRSLFASRGKRKKRKRRSSASLSYVKAFGESRKDSNQSPVLAYSSASNTVHSIEELESDSDPPSNRIREKWREQAHVQFQLRLLQQRHNQEPNKHYLRKPSTVGLQIIGGFDERETHRGSTREYFEFIKYFNLTADLFWMKKRILNWVSKVLCFSKVKLERVN